MGLQAENVAKVNRKNNNAKQIGNNFCGYICHYLFFPYFCINYQISDINVYYILYGICYLISLLPYRVLYGLADGIYLLLYRVVGYRKRVVRKNLAEAFPEMDEKERRQTEHRFYHFLCDYFVESIKLLSVSDKTLLKHIEFRNFDEVERCFDEGQSTAAMLGHYCNWEYLSATTLARKKHPEAVMGLIYDPLSNKAFDRLFLAIRSAKKGECINKRKILRHLLAFKKENKVSLCGYIADQAPKWENIHLWLPFLHHETPVFTGAERIIRKMNNAVFYTDMQRPKRGHYIVTFRLMTRQPQELAEHELTRQFFNLLEQTVRRQPHLYLWSHDRWRRTHEEFDRRFSVVNGKVIPKSTQQ